MTPTNSPQDFLHELLRDAIKRMDDIANRLNEKIDNLDSKMSDEHKDMMAILSKRMDAIEVEVSDHGTKIARHEHNISIATFLFTSGIATIVSWFTWLGALFQVKPHP